MIIRRLLRFPLVIELRLTDSASLHVVDILLAKPIRERHFRQMSPSVPFVLAAAVGQQVASFVVLVIVRLVADQVLPVDELIARIIRIIRPDDGISFAHLTNPFEKFRLIARRQVHLAIDDVIDGSQEVFYFACLKQAGDFGAAATAVSERFTQLFI